MLWTSMLELHTYPHRALKYLLLLNLSSSLTFSTGRAILRDNSIWATPSPLCFFAFKTTGAKGIEEHDSFSLIIHVAQAEACREGPDSRLHPPFLFQGTVRYYGLVLSGALALKSHCTADFCWTAGPFLSDSQCWRNSSELFRPLTQYSATKQKKKRHNSVFLPEANAFGQAS